MKEFQKKAVFLDRDGVINEEIGYFFKSEDFKFINGVLDSCKYFQSIGYILIVITNQSGIARGLYSEKKFNVLNDWMVNRFKLNGVNILDVFYCPHGPDSNCKCRKPEPGMFIEASKKYGIDMNSSWMIGDKETDIKAANRAGIRNTILVKSGHKIKPKLSSARFVLKSLKETIEFIK